MSKVKAILHYIKKPRATIRWASASFREVIESKKFAKSEYMLGDSLDKYHWGSILRIRKKIKKEQYLEICRNIFELSVNKIKTKDKIRICFVQYLDTAWNGDEIIKLFETDPRYHAYVAVTEIERNYKSLKKIMEFYSNKGYEVFQMNHAPKADIYIYSSPYYLNEKGADIRDRKLDELLVMIPYALFFGDTYADHIEGKDFASSQCMWRFFCYTNFHLVYGIENNYLGKINMFYSGYPKLDVFYKEGRKFEDLGLKEYSKCILYAPTLFCEYSTYLESKDMMLELAKEYQDIGWIYRPHPYMGHTLLENEVIDNLQVYEDYLTNWDELSNVVVQRGGDYSSAFIYSNAMISDGTTMISNYQYTKKPLLLLRKEEWKLSDYGRSLFNNQYCISPGDADGARNFIEEVVLRGNDYQYEERIKFFEKNLDYMKKNKMSASEYIVNNIRSSF